LIVAESHRQGWAPIRSQHTENGMAVPIDVSIPVDVSMAPGGRGRIAATVFLPEPMPAAPTVMFALPGGGYSRGYFDLHFPGHDGYSQAAHHVARGVVFVAMDHLGVGASSIDANDVLTIEHIAAANDQAVREILARLRAGTIVAGGARIEPGLVVGTGQSMGGGVTIIMQGRHRTYDAIMPLGYSPVHTSLPQRRPEMREAIKAVFAGFSRRTAPQDLSVPHSSEQIPDFLYPFHFEDVPADIVEADLAGGYPLRQSPPSWGSATVPRCVVAMMSPGYVAEEAASIDVPVFIGFGERDVSEAPHREPTMFPRATDITVFVAPRMAHMHNFASTRRLLWERSLDWVDAMVHAAQVGRSCV
jgi:pimeloyl-ACP methyl ester carboxylesterase